MHFRKNIISIVKINELENVTFTLPQVCSQWTSIFELTHLSRDGVSKSLFLLASWLISYTFWQRYEQKVNRLPLDF